VRRRGSKFGNRPSRWREFASALWAALHSPTTRQKEAYGRYCHTLSAAGWIGSLTLLFSDSAVSGSAVLRACMMVVAAVMLFLTGALLSKGE
jgi:hypothetical protein